MRLRARNPATDDGGEIIRFHLLADQLVAAGFDPVHQIDVERLRGKELQAFSRVQIVHFLFQADNRSGAGEGADIKLLFTDCEHRSACLFLYRIRRSCLKRLEHLPCQVSAGKIDSVEAVLGKDPLRHISAKPGLAEDIDHASARQFRQTFPQVAERAKLKFGFLPYVKQETAVRQRVEMGEPGQSADDILPDHSGKIHRILC